MNNRFTMTLNSTKMLYGRGFSKTLRTIWSMALLLLVFTTGCKKDNFKGEVIGACPIIVSTDPTDNAVDVALNKVITATFNTNMSAATITNASFTITQGSTPVAGTVAKTANGAVFTFTPTTPLLPFVTYTGTITTAATDTLRTALVNNYVWTFKTIPQVSVAANPVLGGTVAVNGVIGATGTAAQGSSATVTAVPNTGFTFTSWVDPAAPTVVVSASPSFQFTMAGNRSLVANFTPVPVGNFAVNVSSSPVAGGITLGSGSYAPGSTVVLTAQANAGYTFVDWRENGVFASASNSFPITVNANRTLIANYAVIPASQFAVVLSSSPPVGGTTAGGGSFVSGTSITITATPNTGYTFNGWSDVPLTTTFSTSSPYTFAVTANRNIAANFTLNTYSLNITANNGVVNRDVQPNATGGLKYNYGTTVKLTPVANPGYVFTGWSGGATGTANPLTVVMTGDMNITANFAPTTFALTINAVNGSVTKNPTSGTNPESYNSGATVVLTAVPAAGYLFSSWSGDATGTVSPLTVTMNAAKNITANFTAIVVTPPLFSSIFGAMGGVGITNTGTKTSINNGAIGTPGVATTITGFHDGLNITDFYTETPLNIGLVTQGVYTAPPAPGSATKGVTAANALAAANAFYLLLTPANRPGGIDLGTTELGGLTLAPGTYKSNITYGITTGDLTLDGKGDPNAVFVFQVGSALTVGLPGFSRSVILIGGAQSKNVYWQVGSSATINGVVGGGTMVGTIIAQASVTISTVGQANIATLNGRAIGLTALVTMNNTIINTP